MERLPKGLERAGKRQGQTDFSPGIFVFTLFLPTGKLKLLASHYPEAIKINADIKYHDICYSEEKNLPVLSSSFGNSLNSVLK